MGTKSPSPPPPSSSSSRKQQRWCNSSSQGTMLTPLMEGPDVHQMHHHLHYPKKHDAPSTSISSWDVIREWFRTQRSISSSTSTNDSFFNSVSSSSSSSNNGSGGESEINARGSSSYCYSNNSNDHMWGKRQDLRLLLGVLGCPLAPIPIPLPLPLPTHHHHQISISTTSSTTTTINHNNNIILNHHHPLPLIPIRDIPIATSTAHYIIQQYLAATGCLKSNSSSSGSSSSSSKKKKMKKKNMYAAGTVNMTCWETEICSGGKTVKKETILGGRRGRSGSIGEKGCFVVWAMGEYSKWWSLELSIGNNNDNNKVLAGSDGTTVWRHTPWLGTHAAKGPHRPLRRLLQGLDPESTGRLFAKAECIGEKRMGEEDCFVLRVAADREEVMERNEGPAEVIRHVLYGYFSQKTGLLLYLEDSHLTRVVLLDDDDDDEDDDDDIDDERVVYWETSIGSSIEDYREVEGLLIAHEGRTIATVFRFSAEQQQQQQQQGGGGGEEQCCSYYSRTRLEEVWRIDDVVFNVPGLSFDSFLPPSDLFPPCPPRSS